MKKILSIAVVFLIVAIGALKAEETEGKPLNMAVQLDLGTMALGSYKANFEYLVGGFNGFMLEAGLSTFAGTTLQLGLAYRLHFERKLDSWYLQVMGKYWNMSGNYTYGNVPYAFSGNYISVIGSLGKRWIFSSKFPLSVNFRLGYGPSYGTFSSTANGITYGNDTDVAKAFNLLYGIFLGFDSELSIGWAF